MEARRWAEKEMDLQRAKKKKKKRQGDIGRGKETGTGQEVWGRKDQMSLGRVALLCGTLSRTLKWGALSHPTPYFTWSTSNRLAASIFRSDWLLLGVLVKNPLQGPDV